MNSTRYISFIFLLLTLVFSSCEDERLSYPNSEDGSVTLRMHVAFKNLEPGLETRTAGNAINNVNSLWVVIYRIDGNGEDATSTFYKKILANDVPGYKIEQSGNSTVPDDGIPSNADNLESTGELTPHATFTLPLIPYGQYRMYAVANVDLNDTKYDCSTEEKLKELKFEWDAEDIGKNNMMFGYFTLADAQTSTGFDAPIIMVNSNSQTIHAWIKRLASKVTVAFDGSQLNEYIKIHPKTISLKRIPASCFLGKTNTVDNENDLIKDGEMITYEGNPFISKNTPFYPAKDASEIGLPNSQWSAHSNVAEALFFFENNQGIHSDIDRRGKVGDAETPKEERYEFIKLPYATFVEVEADWESEDPADPKRGSIIYRFMLGKNVTTNYNAERNYHFKLTLVFLGDANSYDWRIDLEKFLNAEDPQIVDYQGYFFTPVWSIGNLGQNYSQDNDIIVESYEENIYEGTYENKDNKEVYEGKKTFLPLTITFNDGALNADGTPKGFVETPPEWLKMDQVEVDGKPLQRKLKFRYTCQPTETFTVAQKIEAAGTVGSVAAPKDLAVDADGNFATANTYIVGAKGTYILPLVYGNAVDGEYTYKGFTGDYRVLQNLVNYKNEGISNAYILTDIYGTNVPEGITADKVWMDKEDLVTDISYVPNAYGGKGGIRFSVTNPGNGGNAVIAIKDPSGTIMWSWQIWVTYSGFYDDMMLQNLTMVQWPYTHDYTIMPVNLGWCPEDGEKLQYYERHECQVKITNGFHTQVKTIIQMEHLAIPHGNYTYYQWGRKDPFPGSTGDPAVDVQGVEVAKNKMWWHYVTNENSQPIWEGNTTHPPLLNPDLSDDAHTKRDYTKNILNKLIQQPDVWNNPRCVMRESYKPEMGYADKWLSDDKIYSNLWTNNIKTVYDPSPIGFQVSPYKVKYGDNMYYTFGGFVVGDVDNVDAWYNVYPFYTLPDYRNNIVEFYTTQEKLVSSTFIEAGYRDYDYYGNVLNYNLGGVWYAENQDDNNSYYFCFRIKDPEYSPAPGSFAEYDSTNPTSSSVVAPSWAFYTCDGFAVRPTKIPTSAPNYSNGGRWGF